jgi:arylformamidase
MKVIDLTKPIETGMKVFPGDPEVEIKIVHTYKENSWELREMKLGTHTGTHVDAFSHMHKNGKTLDDIPLINFFGHAKVVDVKQEFPRAIGLFFPEQVGMEVFEKIKKSRAPFVGGLIDEELERALLNAEIVTYTNLINLELIPREIIFIFIGLPLKIKQGDGSPVRAIAVIEFDNLRRGKTECKKST